MSLVRSPKEHIVFALSAERGGGALGDGGLVEAFGSVPDGRNLFQRSPSHEKDAKCTVPPELDVCAEFGHR